MEKEKKLFIMPCPPLSQYKEAPKDQSLSTLMNCPKCDNPMWISRKKKDTLKIICGNYELLLGCYICVEKFARKNQKEFKKSQMVKI